MRWIGIGLLALCGSVQAGTIADLDAQGGVFGAKVGASIETSALKPRGTKAGFDVYTSQMSGLRLGPVALGTVLYAVRGGVLTYLVLQADDEDALFAHLISAYGKPTEKNSETRDYTWLGDEVELIYTRPDGTSDGVAVFMKRFGDTGRDAKTLDALAVLSVAVKAGSATVSDFTPSSPAASDDSSSVCPPGKHWVSGYTRKDGTRVKGHCRAN